jgi:hypothetical protein
VIAHGLLCTCTERHVLGYDLTVIVGVAVPKRCPALKVLTPSWLFSPLAACEVWRRRFCSSHPGSP